MSDNVIREFPKLHNDLFIRAAFGEKVERVPVWVMRQAGRYLPEFRNLREQHEFFEICQNPKLAAKVTLQPIERFNLDAAIIFSDILVIPQALGMQVEIKSKIGVSIPDHFQQPDDVNKLKWPEPGVPLKGLNHVYDAISYTRNSLNGKVPLIGFSGGPWTLMGYMIEGGGSNTMSNSKKWLYDSPNASHDLLSKLSNVIVDYLVLQIKAGAQAVQLFESNVAHLGPQLFEEFIAPYLEQINLNVRKKLKLKNLPYVPMIIYAKGAHYALSKLGTMGYDVVSLDWTIPPKLARTMIGHNITLQGNLDPCALYADPAAIKQQVSNMLSAFGVQRYIANLGHGIYPDVNPDHVAVFVDSVHTISEDMIKGT